MLSIRERRSVVRALLRAYHKYRDLSIREICRERRIHVVKDPAQPHAGQYRPLHLEADPFKNWRVEELRQKKRHSEARREIRYLRYMSQFRHEILVPCRGASAGKEAVWWHEFGHLIISRFFPSFVGYHAHLHSFTNDYWEHERLVDAFATAMMLYRNGIDPKLGEGTGSFFFADEKSLGYAQISRFNSQRIAEYCQAAQAVGRNIDLNRLLVLCEHLHTQAESAEWWLQPDLDMGYKDVHRESWDLKHHLTGWFEQWDHNHKIHGEKESWQEALPQEVRLTAWARRLIALRSQPCLFEDMSKDAETRFEKESARFDRAVSKLYKR